MKNRELQLTILNNSWLIRELLRGGVQGNRNNLLNQVKGGNRGRPIVDPIPQIRRRPIVDDDSDDELNFGSGPINPSMGRFERNQNFNYNRHDMSLSLR